MTTGEKRRKEFAQLAGDYHATFTTPHGERVLKHLKKTRMTGPLFRADDGFNTHAAAQRDGLDIILQKIDYMLGKGADADGDIPPELT